MSKPPPATPRPPVHVVAAAIEDLRGRILLTRRTCNRDFAGLWEFPGGKVEPGETPAEALARELHEELGITIGDTAPLIRVPCAVAPSQPVPPPQPSPAPQGREQGPPAPQGRELASPSSAPQGREQVSQGRELLYPPPAQRGEAGRGAGSSTAPSQPVPPPQPSPASQGRELAPSASKGREKKRLLLDVHHLRAWSGRIHGREGQATAWVPRSQLHRYAMPPADGPVVAALTLPPFAMVTPEPDAREPLAAAQTIVAAANATLAAHRDALAQHPGPGLLVRLRTQHLAPAARAKVAAHLARNLPSAARLVLSGDPDLARNLRTGLHLTSAELAATINRPIARNRLLGASCHTLDELLLAEALGCDYAFLGPVAATTTHPDAAPLGWPAFAALREQVCIPLYAIGGMTPDDLLTARTHGAQGIAAIRAFANVSQ